MDYHTAQAPVSSKTDEFLATAGRSRMEELLAKMVDTILTDEEIDELARVMQASDEKFSKKPLEVIKAKLISENKKVREAVEAEVPKVKDAVDEATDAINQLAEESLLGRTEATVQNLADIPEAPPEIDNPAYEADPAKRGPSYDPLTPEKILNPNAGDDVDMAKLDAKKIYGILNIKGERTRSQKAYLEAARAEAAKMGRPGMFADTKQHAPDDEDDFLVKHNPDDTIFGGPGWVGGGQTGWCLGRCCQDVEL
ncbi:MAG TPA: hypothetical protein EYO31_05175 [Phycisphaerales bacterium]|nr:hypothetical protein [Phycisphaerales bacterium]